MSMLNLLASEYEAKKTRYKISLNVSQALNQTGVPSEYVYVNSFLDEVK
jgi:hypothetical protein